MKKYGFYIGFLAIGLLFGWFLFGDNNTAEKEHDPSKNAQKNQKWTCSMHPQILQASAGDCPICGMELIPAKTEDSGLSVNELKLTENAMKLANIQTVSVKGESSSTNSIVLSGKIVENEKKNAVQVSYFSGRIEKLYINFTGDQIKKGDLLATIYSPELFAAQQELLTAARLKASQPKLYSAVKNKLKLWKLSNDQIDLIESTGKVIEKFPVYATVSGTVIEKMVEVGQSIKQGQALFKIADLETLWAEFDVYESQLEYMKVGQEVEVVANAQPNKSFVSRVSFINPVLNTNTRTVAIRVEVNNSKGFLKPGMFVKGKLQAKNTLGSLLIPTSAVLWTGKRSVVYVKTKQNEAVFEMREIEIGSKVGESYQVIQGLKGGEEIVANGAFTVDAAAQLQGKKSMMNMNGGSGFTSHGEHAKKNHNLTKKPIRIGVDVQFQKQLQLVLDEYISLKNGLIKGDAKTVTKASSLLLEKLSKVDVKLLKGEALNTWTLLYKDLQKQTQSLSLASQLKQQRVYFKPLSASFIEAVEKFGINKKVYSQFCPMADNNKGGYWLSMEDKVLNPYFGEAMLTCGEVVKTIK